MIQTFTDFAKENLERQNIVELSAGLIEVAEDPEFTVNSIIGDLIQDKNLLDCFTSNLKIDGKEFYQVDKSLLDLPIPQIRHLLSFADVSLVDLIQKRKEQLEKWEEEEEARTKEIEEELESIREQVKLNKFWDYDDLVDICDLNRPDIYHAAYAIYEEPYNFLKECVQSLRDELYNEDPNMAKLRSLANQISEFFNES